MVRNILYYIAGFIVVVWAISFTLHLLGWVIHTLLLVAAVIFLVRLAQGNKMID